VIELGVGSWFDISSEIELFSFKWGVFMTDVQQRLLDTLREFSLAVIEVDHTDHRRNSCAFGA